MRILIAILVLLAGLGAGYFWFSAAAPEAVETPFILELKQKLAEYEQIQGLSPNLSVFDEKLFQALKAAREEGTPSISATSTAVGRTNPFVPF